MALLRLRKLAGAKGAFSIWKAVFELIVAKPIILVPFCILAVFETLALWFLSCSPHFPINYVMAPLIKSIWRRIYLHYPLIYELVPRVFYYAKIIIGVLLGSVTSAAAVLIVARSKAKEEVDIKKVFLFVLKRYVTLLLLSVILFVSVHYLMKQPQVLLFKYFRSFPKFLFIGPKFWFNVFLPVLTFILAIVLQGIFVYSVPFVIIKGKKLLAALLSGFVLFARNLIKTLLVVLVPMLLYIPVTILRNNAVFLADKFAPEVIMAILFLGILVGTVVVDCLVTVATTMIFIEATHEK
ncbi:MAG: hypothetical protein HZB36_06650 [Candidatus Omnitrophica bacterium]|nr:hypothetical protein [Candidatus Omnitrophota bacterium]